MGRSVRLFVTYLFLALSANLFATEFKSAESFTLASQSRIEDDLIVTGKNVRIDGEVAGDLITFCRSNSIKGRVENSAFNFSQYLDVSGQINGSLTSFCQSLTLSGKVRRNVMAFSADILVAREAVIEGQLIAFTGNLDFEGEARKGLSVHCDEVVITGKIKGDVRIEADKVIILEGAVIDGNLIGVWTDVSMKGFGVPIVFRDALLDMYGKASKFKGTRSYLGLFQGKPAGSCGLVSFDKVGGIFSVGTAPEYRRKGIATALLLKAVTDSLTLGNRTLYLITTKGSDAERLYTSLGFEIAYTQYRYEFHPSTE